MADVFERYGIVSTVFAAVMIGIGAGYLLHHLDQDHPAEALPPLLAASNSAPAEHFVIGPGHQVSSPPEQEQQTAPKPLFKLDKHGDLLVDQSTEKTLDSLLARLPADPASADLHNIETATRAGLPDGAANKAVSLLRDYIAYRNAFSALPGPPETDAPIEQREAYDNRIAYLRSRHFDPLMAEALFGMREAQRVYSAGVLRIATDKSLSPAEKEQQIKALHQSLPPKVAALEFNGPSFSAALEVQVAQMRQRHVSDQDVQNLRRQYFGIDKPASEGGPAEPP